MQVKKTSVPFFDMNKFCSFFYLIIYGVIISAWWLLDLHLLTEDTFGCLILQSNTILTLYIYVAM